MKVHSISLENFRGFKKLDINLEERLNVFIGVNGSGKSSILDAISMNINHAMYSLTSSESNSKQLYLEKDDVNINAKENYIEITYDLESIKQSYKLKQDVFKLGFNWEGKEFSEYFDKLKSNINEKTNLPLVIYYTTAKDFEIENKATANYRFNQLNAYLGNQTKRTFSFKEFTKWFRNEEDKENEVRLRHDNKYESKDLKIVRDAIEKLFSSLGKEQYSDLTIIRAQPISENDFNFYIKPEGELFIKKNNEFLKVSQLSDGEKNVLLTVADIASRIAQLNPSLKYPLENASGIVLIDEIEQHLHPSWQRKVLPALLETFPSLQFIVTTHSENIVLSILEKIDMKKLDYKKIGIYNSFIEDETIKIKKQKLNEHGQIEGGLSNFYLHELKDPTSIFNL